jgi:hypothetical protein
MPTASQVTYRITAHPRAPRLGEEVESIVKAAGNPPPGNSELAPPVSELSQPAALTTTSAAADSTTPVGSTAPAGPPTVGVMFTLVVLAVVLMSYSIVAGVMGDTTLAATAGAGAIALVGEIARRLLAACGKA